MRRFSYIGNGLVYLVLFYGLTGLVWGQTSTPTPTPTITPTPTARDEIFTRPHVRGVFYQIKASTKAYTRILNVTPEYVNMPTTGDYWGGDVIRSSTDALWIKQGGQWLRFPYSFSVVEGVPTSATFDASTLTWYFTVPSSATGVVSATSIEAENVESGTFALNKGGGDFTFTDDVRIDGILDMIEQPMTVDVADHVVVGATYWEWTFDDWDVPGTKWYGVRFRPDMPIVRLMPDSEMTDYVRLLTGAHPTSQRGVYVQLPEGETWSEAWEVRMFGFVDKIDSTYGRLSGWFKPPWVDIAIERTVGIWTPADSQMFRVSRTAMRW